ncbi:NAD-P-binding protein [Vararia minispora EC-137]|uniref:NAD-P-binding protein n=1 Tax=Vararia minispora EC-137 TaxID=1314806 RepID=A0ACB8QXU9_9AGAM|nr:NAD-P-binding protein [Vararia minispora EC-137]
MAIVKNLRAIFAEVPTGYVEPGKHVTIDESQTIDPDKVQLDGGFLVKTLVLSIDPYMRGKMRDPSQKSYSPPFERGEPLYGYGIAVVLRSENSAIQTGDHLYCRTLRYEEYSVYKDASAFRALQNVGVPWTLYVGVLGMPGQTAYYGWKEYSAAQKGETVFVSTAGGAVGSLVVQLAKRDGLKVIASAGSDEKVAFARECGADVSFNYKVEDTNDILAREGGIDIYFDNVGGKQLESALEHAHDRARFIECGMASIYNNPEAYTPKNLMRIVQSELRVFGLLVFRLADKYQDEFFQVMPRLVKDGQIKFKEEIVYGLDKVGQAILDVGTGANSGKVVVIVSEE